MRTVVYQSFRTENVPAWISRCLNSVRAWAGAQGYDYRFVGDEIFDLVPGWYREKAKSRIPVITDLGRLILARNFLGNGYERTIWFDADVLVFDPDKLDMDIGEEFAFGREVWVQNDGKGRLKAYRNVHNAICVFTAGNSFLDFYIHACQSIIGRMEGEMVPQIVGPKLLTSLHNMVGFTLMDEVGMISPLALKDLAEGGGEALDLLRREQPEMRAANLSASLSAKKTDGVTVTEEMVEAAIDRLLSSQAI